MFNTNQTPLKEILLQGELERLIRLSRSSVHRLVKEGTLPKPFKIGNAKSGSKNAWFRADIEAWLESRRAASNQIAGGAA